MTEKFESLRLQLERYPDSSDGIVSSHIIILPDAVRKLLNKMVRQGPLSTNEVALELELTEDETRQILEILLGKKIVKVFHDSTNAQAVRYGVQLGRTRPQGSPR